MTLIETYGPARGDLTAAGVDRRMLRLRRALKREPNYTTDRADTLVDVAIRLHLSADQDARFSPRLRDCERCDGTGQVIWESNLGTPLGRTELGQCPDCSGSGVIR